MKPDETPEMLSLKQLKLFIDLYQFLQPKKAHKPNLKIDAKILSTLEPSTDAKTQLNTRFKILPSTCLNKDTVDITSGSRSSNSSRNLILAASRQKKGASQPKSDIKSLQEKLETLAKCITEKFDKISTAFKTLDKRGRGYATYSDLAYFVEQLKLGYGRDLILQIFTYLDTDWDNKLRYCDFCNLCS